jgi:uncharacterized protein YbjT (DUF2867 family)
MNAGEPACRLFVTGATGYLGSRLIPLLLERGHHVTALTRRESVTKVPSGCEVVVGNPLESQTFAEQLHGADTLVQLVGIPKPAPWKGPQFRAVDGPSATASISAARAANVQHVVYVSVAQPAPIMKDYLAVRSECEAAITAAGLIATILRPWYILGPGHRWPLALLPMYGLLERLPATRDAATRLGLVTIQEMLAAMVWSIEHLPDRTRVIEVPEIRRLGRDNR